MTEVTESLLRELSRGLRKDVDKEVERLFGLTLFKDNGYANKSVRFKFIINVQGARLVFVTWLIFEPNKRQEVFSHIKDHFQERYGLKLTNQRLYTFEVVMEFGETEELVDPMETYTLLKINQII